MTIRKLFPLVIRGRARRGVGARPSVRADLELRLLQGVRV